MSIKTRKIKLIPIGDNKEIRKDKISYVKDISNVLSKVGNEVIRLHVGNQYEIDNLVKGRNITKGEARRVLEDKLGTSIRNSGYQQMSSYPQIPSSIRAGFNSVRKSKLTFPISARNNKDSGVTSIIKIINDKYVLSLPTSNGSNLGDMGFELFFGRDRSNNKIIVDRILKGEYKLCDSNISIQDNDLYFLLTVNMPQDENVILDHSKIMGVDVGINRPVSIYIINEQHQPMQITIGEKIQHDRIRISKKRQKLQQSLKYTSGGHGVKNKLKQLNTLKKSESDWSKLMNHKISKELIDMCLKFKVGTIHMEDLTGITSDTNNYFLKSWKYYELQNFIKYKAEFVGINIVWVNPAYTSQTCPECGEFSSENRNKTKFKCTNKLCRVYELEKDADINAAENIAKKDGNSVKEKSKKGKIEKIKALK